jgi:hypothetical protein
VIGTAFAQDTPAKRSRVVFCNIAQALFFSLLQVFPMIVFEVVKCPFHDFRSPLVSRD